MLMLLLMMMMMLIMMMMMMLMMMMKMKKQTKNLDWKYSIKQTMLYWQVRCTANVSKRHGFYIGPAQNPLGVRFGSGRTSGLAHTCKNEI